ncbi:MAG: glycosyltransferase family 4 protein [Gammaproteobacteria bacterium]
MRPEPYPTHPAPDGAARELPRRIALVTDAWRPQVNGVVTTLTRVSEELQQLGRELLHVTPGQFHTVPCPTYPSIRLALLPGTALARALDRFGPDAIHVATEGPLGHAARRYCLHRGLPFTTAFHTQFPEYVRARAPVPIDWTYSYLRRFHGAARRTFVGTPAVRDRLERHGFRNLILWSRGVDHALFRPRGKAAIDAPRPISLYVGRVAVEKNIEAFLDLDIPGTKVVIGEGPDRARLQARYGQVRFLGQKLGEDLAEHVSAADVFVFPSLTDTFGIVMLEAMACGVPVAAFPVPGPLDVVADGVSGVLDTDLGAAVAAALRLDPDRCVRYAGGFSWRSVAETFLGGLAPIPDHAP